MSRFTRLQVILLEGLLRSMDSFLSFDPESCARMIIEDGPSTFQTPSVVFSYSQPKFSTLCFKYLSKVSKKRFEAFEQIEHRGFEKLFR
ncbi:hypothetical protein [Pseudothermotoga sp.]|uniref:hypothetical protein n=1 Tax=Pseudothermotoga sp. TaxID=2033661 RepID=UPI0031F6D8F6